MKYVRALLRRCAGGLKDNKGRSMVEMLMVFSLLAVFGVACFTLIFTGSRAYSNIADAQLKESRARVVLNLITGKVRQNDIEQAVEATQYLGNDALLLESYTNPEENARVVQWIFFSDGVLYECLLDAGEQPPENLALVTRIAELDAFYVDYDAQNNAVTATLVYDGQNNKQVSGTVTLRSAYRAGEDTDATAEAQQ